MIISEAKNNIELRWRDENDRRVNKTITNFKPYFFIERTEQMPEYIESSSKYGANRIKPTYVFGEWKSLGGKELTKVVFDTVGDFHNGKKHWTITYEADIGLARKYTNDCMEEIKEYNLRKWYLDIETQVGGRYDGQINALTFYDSFDDYYYVMTHFPIEPLPSYKDVLVYEDEQDMLEAFVKFVEDKDPDMIIGWYVLGFDIPTILKRLIANDINPKKLSPHREVRGVSHNRVYNVNYANTSQPIKGRITYCLMTRFERLWLDSQKGTLPSLKLDYCSRRLLGEDIGKEKSNAKFGDDEFFLRSWLEDTEVFLEYNRVDVELMVRMDNEMNITENDIALQHLFVCPFECVFHNSQMGAAYFMRHSDWIAPTGQKGIKTKYEAAFVMNPEEEDTFGLHENVAVFDFKSLYPSMMASRNISWETKSNHDNAHNVYFSTPKNLREWKGENISVSFRKDKLGVLPNAVLTLMKMRDGYKKNMRNAKTDEEYRKWDSAQMATKRGVNALYGVLAKDGYGWGDMEMAQAITASAREAMRSVAFKAIELGYEVIYGHTDSIFVKVKNVDDAKGLCILLNQHIQNEVFNEHVVLEFEKYAKSFFLSMKKNRYCGYLSWKDGKDVDEFFVMGFEMKKSNETKLAKEVQSKILQMVAQGKSESMVTKYAKAMYKIVKAGKYKPSSVIKQSRLRKSLDEYDSIAGGSAGVLFYNQEIGEIKEGDSYYYYTVDNKGITKYPRQYETKGRVRNVDYIAFKKLDEVIDNFPINWSRLAESEISKKVKLIYESLRWDLSAIANDGRQTTLDNWW